MSLSQNEIIDFSILFRAAAERVFDAVATASGIDANKSIAVGDAIFLRWGNWGLADFSENNSATIRKLTRPTQFNFVWNSRGNMSEVEVAFTFSSHEDGTLVRLIESGFVAPQNELQQRAAAWAQALIALKFYLENTPA